MRYSHIIGQHALRCAVLKLTKVLFILIIVVWSYRHFSLTSSSKWDIALSLITESSFYSSDLTLLTVHVLSENKGDTSIRLDKIHAAYRLSLREVPAGLFEHVMLNVNRGKLIADKNLMPANGWEVPSHKKFQDTFSIVLRTGTKVAICAELTSDDDFTNVGKFVHVAP